MLRRPIGTRRHTNRISFVVRWRSSFTGPRHRPRWESERFPCPSMFSHVQCVRSLRHCAALGASGTCGRGGPEVPSRASSRRDSEKEPSRSRCGIISALSVHFRAMFRNGPCSTPRRGGPPKTSSSRPESRRTPSKGGTPICEALGSRPQLGARVVLNFADRTWCRELGIGRNCCHRPRHLRGGRLRLALLSRDHRPWHQVLSDLSLGRQSRCEISHDPLCSCSREFVQGGVSDLGPWKTWLHRLRRSRCHLRPREGSRGVHEHPLAEIASDGRRSWPSVISVMVGDLLS